MRGIWVLQKCVCITYKSKKSIAVHHKLYNLYKNTKAILLYAMHIILLRYELVATNQFIFCFIIRNQTSFNYILFGFFKERIYIYTFKSCIIN